MATKAPPHQRTLVSRARILGFVGMRFVAESTDGASSQAENRRSYPSEFVPTLSVASKAA